MKDMNSVQVILYSSILYLCNSATIPNVRPRNARGNSALTSGMSDDIVGASQDTQKPVFKRETIEERNKRRCDLCRNTHRCKKLGKCGLCDFYCNETTQVGSTTVSPLIVEPESAFTFTYPLPDHIAARQSATEGAEDDIVGMTEVPVRRPGSTFHIPGFFARKSIAEGTEDDIIGMTDQSGTTTVEPSSPNVQEDVKKVSIHDDVSLETLKLKRPLASPMQPTFGPTPFIPYKRRQSVAEDGSDDIIGMTHQTATTNVESSTPNVQEDVKKVSIHDDVSLETLKLKRPLASPMQPTFGPTPFIPYKRRQSVAEDRSDDIIGMTHQTATTNLESSTPNVQEDVKKVSIYDDVSLETLKLKRPLASPMQPTFGPTPFIPYNRRQSLAEDGSDDIIGMTHQTATTNVESSTPNVQDDVKNVSIYDVSLETLKSQRPLDFVGMTHQSAPTVESSTPNVQVTTRFGEGDTRKGFIDTVVPKFQNRLYTIGEILPGPHMKAVSRILNFKDPTIEIEKFIVLAKTKGVLTSKSLSAESLNYPLIIDAANVLPTNDAILTRLIDTPIDGDDAGMYSKIHQYVDDAVTGKSKQQGAPSLSIGDIDRIIDYTLISEVEGEKRDGKHNETLLGLERESATHSLGADDEKVAYSQEKLEGPASSTSDHGTPSILNRNDNDRHRIDNDSNLNPEIIGDALNENVGTSQETAGQFFEPEEDPNSSESSQFEDSVDRRTHNGIEKRPHNGFGRRTHNILKDSNPLTRSELNPIRVPSMSRFVPSSMKVGAPNIEFEHNPEEAKSAESFVGSSQPVVNPPTVRRPEVPEDEFVDLRTYVDELENKPADMFLGDAKEVVEPNDNLVGDINVNHFEDGIFHVIPHINSEDINGRARDLKAADLTDSSVDHLIDSLVGKHLPVNDEDFVEDEHNMYPVTPHLDLKMIDAYDEKEGLGLTDTPDSLVGDQRVIIKEKDYLVDDTGIISNTTGLNLTGVEVLNFADSEETVHPITTEPSNTLNLMDTIVGLKKELNRELQEEQVLNFGKVISASGDSVLENNLNDNVFFIGNGIKLPLKVARNEDGSLQLTVDIERLCSCKNDTCPKAHVEEEMEDPNFFNPYSAKSINRAKRTLHGKNSYPGTNIPVDSAVVHKDKKENQHRLVDEKYDQLSEIKNTYQFEGSDNKVMKEDKSVDRSEESDMTYDSSIVKSNNKIITKERLEVVKEILDWMKKVASSYTTAL